MVTAFARNSADGWSMATASARDLLADRAEAAADDGGDFAAEAHRLGEAVAAVHATLARRPRPRDRTAPVDTLLARQRAAAEVAPELAVRRPT